MSTQRRATARAPSSLTRLRAAAAALALLPLVATLLLPGASAEPPAGVSLLGPAQARRAGLALELVRHPELPVNVVEVRHAAPRPTSVVHTLLDVAEDGAAALADQFGLDPATLIVAHPDGSQLRAAVRGLIAAEFAPDGSWLAVVDGAGALLRLEADDGESALLAPGPFMGPIVIEPAGTLLALAVSSVQAPFRSRLVRVDPATGEMLTMLDEELVYGAQLLSDGGIGVVAHRPSGTVVLRSADGSATVLADLGAGAVNVSLSGDARVMAWEQSGEIVVRPEAGASSRTLGSGSNPRVAPDGSAVLFEQAGKAVLATLDGVPLARLSSATAFASCGRCQP